MFDKESIAFLNALSANNTREWFQAHKADYTASVATPAKMFTQSLAALLQRKAMRPVTPKIFRINRDLRFSKDKTPYNTHIHIAFPDPDSGLAWMVGLERDRLVLGYGCFQFAPMALDRWRRAIDGPEGETLASVLNDLRAQQFRIDPPELKRVPAPYSADHPHQDLLRHKSIAAWHPDLAQSEAFGQAAPERIAKRLAVFDQLRDWTTRHLG